jgi:hypothetical protein
MATQKRQREEWFSLVDEIAQNDTRAALPQKDATLKQFLPRPVPDAAVRYIQSKATDPDVLRCSNLFQPQMSYLEAMHALPVASSTEHQRAKREIEHALDMKASVMPLMSRSFSQNVKAMNMHQRPPEGFATGPYHQWSKRSGTLEANFNPIIFVASEPSAPIQIFNVRTFLEDGKFRDPTATIVDEGSGTISRIDKPHYVIVQPGSFLPCGSGNVRTAFRKFKVVDDVSQVDNWKNVCACFVTGKDWQFDRWFPDDPEMRNPSRLFHEVRGFLPFFEEDKVPPKIKEWHVHPVVLNRKLTRSNASTRQAQAFWEELYKFLDSHPRFRQHTIAPLEEI